MDVWFTGLDIRFRWVGLLALALALVVTPLVMALGRRFGLVDEPGGRKAHRGPIPFTGGIALFVAFMVPSVLTIREDAPVQGVLLPATIIFAMGLVDDARGLPSWFRLLGQLVACLLLVKAGVAVKLFPWQPLNVAVTVVGVMGITNALNFLDNMDGLAAGLVCTSCLAFFSVAWLTGQRWLGVYATSLAGACLGFLAFNVKPAKIFMGDSGSTFLGFCLAALAIMGDWSKSTVIACSIPLVAMSILIFDTTLTTILRVKTGKVSTVKEWIDYAGRDHLSHRMVEMGLDESKAVLLIHVTGVALAVVSILLVNSNVIVALGIMVMVFLFFVSWFLLVKDIPGLESDGVVDTGQDGLGTA